MLKSTVLKQTYHETLQKSSKLKRFFERWISDPKFRNLLLENPRTTLEKYFIDVPQEQIQYLIDDLPGLMPDEVRELWNVSQQKKDLTSTFYLEESLPKSSGMMAWRMRQINRQRLDLGPFFTNNNIHSSLTLELSQGCSVGCWFCALSPESFKEYYDYDIYKEEWNQFLSVMHEYLGNAFKSTFLYWATEPFDNPFYEQFCIDVYNECGVFPPTTTAIAHKQVERIKDFLIMSSGYDCWQNRFSVTALGLLTKVHKAYTSQELAEVECLVLNKKSTYAFGNAGEFRERVKKDPSLLEEQDKKLRNSYWHSSDKGYSESEDYANGSICCVTGFLVNMVNKNIQLISPITASDEWPLGYIIFDERKFTDISNLQEILRTWERQFFIEKLTSNDKIKFHEHLDIKMDQDVVKIIGRFGQSVEFDLTDYPKMDSLVSKIALGQISVGDLITFFDRRYNASKEETTYLIDQLFKNGLFYGY